MSCFNWGIASIPIGFGALVLLFAVAFLVFAIARHVWGMAHYALMGTTKLARNRSRLHLRGEPADDSPEHLDAANQVRDALLESPRLHTFAGLGWRLVLFRDTRAEPEQTGWEAKA